ncbi:dihydropyrimidinase [Desulforhopalus sp. IMCC35007]|uniref:dihydropyrimidinase n=1 Tax=Desulforhopalus sp. IMCC35007 TaxID=2569543 RepID=UPI0010AE3972|nr:dihydropyrimidinase [Desulforhopalus sp. IMCC35007]TKB06777.1 dihydropyrimidinase [Desulforhopalus sp. IMCC35007]
MQDILIKNGLIVTAEKSFNADLLISSGKIKRFGDSLDCPGSIEIDATGKYLMPGGIDAHTHLNLHIGDNKVSDGFYEGSVAAAFGGTTCVVEHPSFGPDNCSLMHQVDAYKEEGGRNSVVDFGIHGVFQHVDANILDECATLLKAGVSSAKVYMTYSGRLHDLQILSVLQRAKEIGLLTTYHAENNDIIDFLSSRLSKKQAKDPYSHSLTRPACSEVEAIFRLISMSEALGGVPIYIVHLSTAAGLLVIESARDRGLEVYAEVCPQHLLLTDSCYQESDNKGLQYIMAPPPRKKEDIDALWQGLARGTIDVVATDHCSFNFSAKLAKGKDDFRLAPGGIPGVETRLPLLFSEGVLKKKISLSRFVEVVSTAPAKLMGLFPQKGHLAPGADADVIVFDPNLKNEKILTPKNLRQNADYSPYEGMSVRGWPTTTIIRGQLVVHEGQLLVEKGWGQYVNRRQAVKNSTVTGD